MIDRPPEYGMTCHCGMRITGTNEKGLVSLFKKHYEVGEYHVAYETITGTKGSEQEIVIARAIAQREKKMPVPEGDITTSEILVPEEVAPVEEFTLDEEVIEE